MKKENSLSFSTKEVPMRIMDDGEKRQYFIFNRKDLSFPFELIITEMPPNYMEPFHKHEVINETTVVLCGEAVGVTQENNMITEYPIKSLSFYIPKINDIDKIIVNKDGTFIFVLKNKKTGKTINKKLIYGGGFDKSHIFHTIRNKTDQWVIMATIKSVNLEALKKYPKIFKEDKISLE